EAPPDAEDRRHIVAAVFLAKLRNPAVSESIFDFLRSILLLQDPEGLDQAQIAERRDFVLRFQQLTGPVAAKGLEDTAFYRSYALASLNEVGGDPETFGIAADRFHQHNVERLRSWPHGLSATSTHDNKRSEDIRTRISALSEIPEDWDRAIQLW